MGNMDKLKLLEENIKILQEIKNSLSIEEIKFQKRYEWEIRYGLLESIQIVIDIACKITSKYNLGNPKNYKECIEFLEKFHYLEKNLAKKLRAMVGLRNLLIHEYIKIDKEKLYYFLENLNDFIEFAKNIEQYL